MDYSYIDIHMYTYTYTYIHNTFNAYENISSVGFTFSAFMIIILCIKLIGEGGGAK